MPRPATGQIVEPKNGRAWAVRVPFLVRVAEAVARDWPDVSLPAATIDIGRAKTDAGVRHVDIPIGPLQELTEWRSRRPTCEGDGDPVFVTQPTNGQPVARQTRRNIEARVKVAIKVANARLDELGIEPISKRAAPHTLRRAYASLRAACGDDPVYIAAQLGHAGMALTYRLYQRAVKRRVKLAGNHLREFDRALEWAANGQQSPIEVLDPRSERHESPCTAAISC